MHALLHVEQSFKVGFKRGGDAFVAGISVPKRDCVSAVLSWKDDAEDLARWHVKLLSNYS